MFYQLHKQIGHMAHIWEIKEQLMVVSSLLYHMGPGIQAQVVWLDSRWHIYLLSHLMDP